MTNRQLIADSIGKSKSPAKKNKQQMRQLYRRQIQQAKLQAEREQAKHQITQLKQTGLTTAYEMFLRDICKNGLPDPANVYQLAAQFILKFEKKHKTKLKKKQQLQRQNNDSLHLSKQYSTIAPLSQRKRSTFD